MSDESRLDAAAAKAVHAQELLDNELIERSLRGTGGKLLVGVA